MKDPQIILSTVLAIATVAYTIINALMLSESRKVRKQKNAPLLVAFLEYSDDNNVVSVVLKNIGEGCAKNVKITVLKDYNRFHKENMPLSNSNAFKNGVSLFPAQYKQVYNLQWSDGVTKSANDAIELEIQYEPLTNNRALKSFYTLSFNQISGDYINPPVSFLGKIPHNIKEQTKVLSKMETALSKIAKSNNSDTESPLQSILNSLKK